VIRITRSPCCFLDQPPEGYPQAQETVPDACHNGENPGACAPPLRVELPRAVPDRQNCESRARAGVAGG
jgi:hypothetical protein